MHVASIKACRRGDYPLERQEDLGGRGGLEFSTLHRILMKEIPKYLLEVRR
jgi:hypothetical protein